MKKPYKLLSFTKSKKPRLIGCYATWCIAEQALELYQARNAQSQLWTKRFPGLGRQDLLSNLKIIKA